MTEILPSSASDAYQTPQPSISTRALKAKEYIEQRLNKPLLEPQIGIVCGSGLGGLANALLPTPRTDIKYDQIPYFPKCHVPGHAGKLVFGVLDESHKPVVLMVGRAHYYEGNSIEDIGVSIRILSCLGVDTMFVTNAAGGLNPEYDVGDVVVLQDHINFLGLAGIHPLRGPNIDEFGPRFPAMSDAYDLDLRRRAHYAWQQSMSSQNRPRKLQEGVYAFVGGPSYETRAECRMLLKLGADLVGMSTVPEILVARHCGMRVLALSVVTNKAVLDPGPKSYEIGVQESNHEVLTQVNEHGKANHIEVLETSRKAASDIQLLICSVARDLLGTT